jgi:hypothetical protein
VVSNFQGLVRFKSCASRPRKEKEKERRERERERERERGRASDWEVLTMLHVCDEMATGPMLLLFICTPVPSARSLVISMMSTSWMILRAVTYELCLYTVLLLYCTVGTLLLKDLYCLSGSCERGLNALADHMGWPNVVLLHPSTVLPPTYLLHLLPYHTLLSYPTFNLSLYGYCYCTVIVLCNYCTASILLTSCSRMRS